LTSLLIAVIVEVGQVGGDPLIMEQKQKPDWQSILEHAWGAVREALIPRRLSKGQVIWAIRIVVALAVVVIILSLAIYYDHVGSENAAVIAAFLALVGVLIAQVVNARLEDRRAQATLLQSYLDRMGNLLTTDPTDSAIADKARVQAARAQTLAVLEGLRSDPTRKRILLHFLKESDLIHSVEKTVIDLDGADLRWAYLYRAHLDKANLSGAKLIEANLSGANLSGANLSGANLRGADLSGADLRDADLRGADLRDTDLRGAVLSDTLLTDAIISAGTRYDQLAAEQ
jgi:uncharacterized protein YjbI with pentapeptide repeats